MGKIAIMILGLIAICFLIPAMAALGEVETDTEKPQPNDSEEVETDSTMVLQKSEIRELCPSITRVPLMYGKPAPCPATYPLF
ncbi:MAG: hypothetical protein AB1746_02465 [Candidatus Zixiibacteriota bacterium]